MIGANLIPARRAAALRRRERVRRWGLAAGVLTLLLSAGLGALWGSRAGASHDLDPALAAATSNLERSERALASAKARLSAAQKAAAAASVLADLPDWGVLLDLLASKLGDDAVYTMIGVSPDVGSAGASGKATPKVDTGARPERYLVRVSGLARGQGGVSRLVLALEETRLFDRVTLVESRRVGEGTEETMAFSLACNLSDSAGGVR